MLDVALKQKRKNENFVVNGLCVYAPEQTKTHNHVCLFAFMYVHTYKHTYMFISDLDVPDCHCALLHVHNYSCMLAHVYVFDTSIHVCASYMIVCVLEIYARMRECDMSIHVSTRTCV